MGQEEAERHSECPHERDPSGWPESEVPIVLIWEAILAPRGHLLMS